MPTTRAKRETATKRSAKAKAVTTQAKKKKPAAGQVASRSNETAYEKLYNKWQEMKKKAVEGKEDTGIEINQNKQTKQSKQNIGARFTDEDDFMELSMEDPEQLSKDFPSQSEDEKSEGEISDEEQFESQPLG